MKRCKTKLLLTLLFLVLLWISQTLFTGNIIMDRNIARKTLSSSEYDKLPTEMPTLPPTSNNPQVFEVYNSQWVNGSKLNNDKQIFLYSAYQDSRKSSFSVRILGIAPNKCNDKLSCVLEDAGGERVVTDLIYKQIKENWNLKYSSYFFNCEHKQTFKPDKVTVIPRGQNITSSYKWVRVINNYPSDVKTRLEVEKNLTGMSVCVKPFHNQYNRAVWLVEFIEFYLLLGATHFYFYNHTVGSEVQQILRLYKSTQLITILPWQLPVVTKKEIRTEGLFTALNDCVFRSMYKHKYAAMVDVDEFIVPKKFKTIPELLDTKDDPTNGAFIFKNAFFYLYWENQTLSREFERSPYLITMFKRRRLKKLHTHGTRSKYVVKPEKVLHVGNHAVWEHMPGYKSFKVASEEGISHHYRICEFGGFKCMKEPSEIDNSTTRFELDLFSRVDNICKQVFGEVGCPPAPPLGSPY